MPFPPASLGSFSPFVVCWLFVRLQSGSAISRPSGRAQYSHPDALERQAAFRACQSDFRGRLRLDTVSVGDATAAASSRARLLGPVVSFLFTAPPAARIPPQRPSLFEIHCCALLHRLYSGYLAMLGIGAIVRAVGVASFRLVFLCIDHQQPGFRLPRHWWRSVLRHSNYPYAIGSREDVLGISRPHSDTYRSQRNDAIASRRDLFGPRSGINRFAIIRKVASASARDEPAR
jgi:hypothetical protein